MRAQLRRNELVILVCTFTKLKQLSDELQPRHIRYLIVDEADEMIRKTEVQQFLARLRARCEDVRFAFFSATYSDESVQLIAQQVPGCREVRAGRGVPEGPHNVRQYTLLCEEEGDRADYLAAFLARLAFVQAVVFANSHRAAEQAHALLAQRGFRSVLLHSKLPLSERIGNLRRFVAGERRVLVATDIFGRGMDVRGVTLIVNYEVPAESRHFVHRSGRTGRYGRRGCVVSLVNA